MSETPLFKNVENDGLDCRLFGYICDLEERGGFYDAAEVYLAKLGAGFAETELPVTKAHLSWQGMVQEGVYLTESAAAINFAVHTLDKIGTLTKLNLEIIELAGKSTVLICDAKITAQIDGKITAEVKITDQNGKLLAQGSGEAIEKNDFIYTYAEYLRSIGYEND